MLTSYQRSLQQGYELDDVTKEWLYTSEEVDVLEVREDIKEGVWLVRERRYSIVGNLMWIAGGCELRTIEKMVYSEW